MSVLVTGGMGLIGKRSTMRLAASGERVISFDIAPGPAHSGKADGEVKLVRGDVTCIEDLIAAIQRYKVEKILHLAVQRHGLHAAMRISALGANGVFEAARLTGVKRIAFASSVAYHGPQAGFGERPVTELDHGFPTIAYGAIKWMNEFMAGEYNRHYGMEVIALRISLVYGWGQRGGLNWTNDMIEQPAKGEPVSVPCRSRQKVCLIHVDDVAEIFTRLIQKDKPAHAVYHSGGFTCTLEEMAGIVREFIPEARISFEEQAEELPFAYLIDNGRLKKDLGVKLRSLKDGIAQVIDTARRSPDA